MAAATRCLLSGDSRCRPDDNRQQQNEGIDLIRTAFLNDPFTFIGEYYKIPPRTLIPKPVQYPHPPLSMAATSPQSHTTAASKGIGVASFANFSGFEHVRKNLGVYDDVFSQTEHELPTQKDKAVLVAGLICAETHEQARAEFEPLVEYTRLAVDAYDRLATTNDDYSYMATIKETGDDKGTDVDYLINESASFVVGTPDECIDQVRRSKNLVLTSCGCEWIRLATRPRCAHWPCSVSTSSRISKCNTLWSVRPTRSSKISERCAQVTTRR